MAIEDAKILIVDDDEDILTAGKLLLKRCFHVVATCSHPREALGAITEQSFDAILLDMNFGPGDSSGEAGLQCLSQILNIDPDAIVIVITAHGGVKQAVEAMKLGATDFIVKPWQNEKLIATLSTGIRLRRSLDETTKLRNTNSKLTETYGEPRQHILGKSQAMRTVLDTVARCAPTDANILVLGENGTGKELVAREIHRQSLRKDKAFISIDLGSISENLFESEVFGHKKGAFTGAQNDRIGWLQIAHGGTLFLDEVGNLPLHLQAKLLSVLEQRRVTPVGSDRSVPIDIRVISATNMSATQLRAERNFRQDLLFRLNTVEITLPPLRARPEDIVDIATYYTALYSRKYGPGQKTLSDAAIQALQNYNWPGNIRALKHAIERAVILSDHEELSPRDFQLEPIAMTVPHAQNRAISHPLDVSVENKSLNLETLERETVKKVLIMHHYNISRAAKELGLTRAALYRRIEKHDL